jgi:hypothetical protein
VILYTLYCDAPGCLRSIESAFGDGIQLPPGWSEYQCRITMSNGQFSAPSIRTVTKHYCVECRARVTEHAAHHTAIDVLGPDTLPSGRRDRNVCECGFRFGVKAQYLACPSCGTLRAGFVGVDVKGS